MESDRNDVAPAETLLQSSVQLPPWMIAQLDVVARRNFTTRSAVIRRLLADGLEREAAGVAVKAAS